MASEGSTMQRGPAAGPPGQGNWSPEATAPTGRRLPGPQRERKPVLAALALLLIIGGALGAGFLVLQSNKRVPAIVVAQPVAAGAKIPAAALQRTEVSVDSGVQFVSWTDAGQVTQDYAATSIPAGTLLSAGMVAPAAAVAHRGDVLGLALKDGQFPTGLTAGNRVAIYATGGQGSSGSGCGGPGGLLSGNATVIAVNSPGTSGLVGSAAGGSISVSVAVSPADAGAVACNAAAGQVAVALLPPGATQAPASVPASPSSPAPGGGATGQPSAAPSSKASASHSPGTQTGHG